MFRSLIRPKLVRGLRPQLIKPQLMVLPGLRFASTNTNEKLSEITTELSQFTDELPLQSPLTSDQLGYLDSIGLAQGFGPTAMVERVMEYAHVYTGLPWWATIIGVSLSLRFVMFPLYVRATRNAAKVSKIKPELDDIMRGLRNAENPQEQAELTRRRQKLSKDNDIHMTHQFLPAVSQIVFGYASYQALTKMARFPVQGFSEQGAYWFQDLSQVDPYLGLQVISAAAFLAMFKLGSKAGMSEFGPTQMSAPMQKLMYAMPIVTIFITKNLPAAFILYLATNSIFSILQSLIFNNKTCRKWLKIPPMVRHAPKPQDNNLGDWWKDFKDQTNKNTQKNMRQSDKRLAARRKRNLDSNNNYIKRH
ncbi:mitochondrial inner membrane protein Oxa1p [[Candida] jaroonii]|uniref:Mitochondrial inner membrane protein Oxa1p n=1 Tax=[Candida] jaroonii TaxID=467808 RepID=A0ACA9YGF3_9ASCO|nr:mitochondrial inner membrane protein Oxa1p [[Candida] jaroonii]